MIKVGSKVRTIYGNPNPFLYKKGEIGVIMDPEILFGRSTEDPAKDRDGYYWVDFGRSNPECVMPYRLEEVIDD